MLNNDFEKNYNKKLETKLNYTNLPFHEMILLQTIQEMKLPLLRFV